MNEADRHAEHARNAIAYRAAQWAYALRWEEIPAEVVDHTKLRILDVAGVLLAASSSEEARRTHAGAQELYGRGPHPVVGFAGEGCGLAGAALVDGALSAILEFDDTHIESAIHPTAPAAAVALPFVAVNARSGRELLRTVLLGSEILCRIGQVGPRFHGLLFHPTGLLGVFGAAYTLGELLGLSPETITHAVGLAGSMAAGSMSSWDDGSDAKSLQPGLAAASAVRAVVLARQGLTGPFRIFESDFGFFKSHVQGGRTPLRFERILEGLGSRWESLAIASKAYPSAFTIHPYVDAILALRAQGLRAEQVERIVCGVPEFSINRVLEPRADKLRPRTPWQARISVQHMVAEALVTGVMDKSSMTRERLRDPAINAIADRIEYFAEPRFSDPTRSGGDLYVHLKDGRALKHAVDDMRGTRYNPISREDYYAKFRRNADGVIPRAAADRAIEGIMTLDAAADAGAALADLYPREGR